MICPDNRGVGGSGLGDGELSVEGMAADMETLLDALGIERAPVVGWSMGGFAAQRLAARSPGRLAALALLSTDPGGADSVPADPEVWARLVDHSGSDREQAARLISLLFPPPLAADIDGDFGEIVAAARADLSPRTLRAQEAAMDAWHRNGSAPSSQREVPPILVLHGELDEVIPPANAETLATHWLGAQVELFAGCGHALMAQEPQRIAALIEDLAAA